MISPVSRRSFKFPTVVMAGQMGVAPIKIRLAGISTLSLRSILTMYLNFMTCPTVLYGMAVSTWVTSSMETVCERVRVGVANVCRSVAALLAPNVQEVSISPTINSKVMGVRNFFISTSFLWRCVNV